MVHVPRPDRPRGAEGPAYTLFLYSCWALARWTIVLKQAMRKETWMIELRLGLQPYYDDRRSRVGHRVPHCPIASHKGSRSCSSPDSDERKISFCCPTLPRRSAAPEEDSFEFGALRCLEIEL